MIENNDEALIEHREHHIHHHDVSVITTITNSLWTEQQKSNNNFRSNQQSGECSSQQLQSNCNSNQKELIILPYINIPSANCPLPTHGMDHKVMSCYETLRCGEDIIDG